MTIKCGKRHFLINDCDWIETVFLITVQTVHDIFRKVILLTQKFKNSALLRNGAI